MDKTAEQDSGPMLPVKPLRRTFTPTFPTPRWSRPIPIRQGTVAENTPAGTNIGDPVAASDTDVLTYSLGGTDEDASSFDINRATGHIDHQGGTLDHEDSGKGDHLFTR